MAPTKRRVPEVPTFTGRVQVPFYFFEKDAFSQHLDLFDADAASWKAATGEEPPPPEPPHDPFTAWVALAYVGGIEAGGPVLRPGLNREQRLEIASHILSEEQLLVVETLAVPKRFRELRAGTLEEMIYRAEDYLDRLWAGCWLILTGWTVSRSCRLRDVSEAFPVGKLEHAILDAYARSVGVDRQDNLGWKRIGGNYQSNLILHRLAICETHYRLNGPPRYQYMKETVHIQEGWRPIVYLVPDGSD